MAIRKITIGSAVNVFQYDDAVFPNSIVTEGPIKCTTPIDPNDVVRLEDLTDFIGSTLTTIDDNLKEVMSLRSKVSNLLNNINMSSETFKSEALYELLNIRSQLKKHTNNSVLENQIFS